MKHVISLVVFTIPLVAAPALAAEDADPAPERAAQASPAREGSADEGFADERPSYERGGLSGVGFTAGAKLGLGLSQPFNEALGTSPVLELELGYLLPPLDRSLQLFVSGQYAAPGGEESGIEDPERRLPGPMSYEVQQQQAIVTLGALYRVRLPTPLFRPYGALGGRMYLLRTTISGSSGGQEFGENDETATAFGFYGALGGEAYLGPGAVLLELQVAHAPADGFVLRDTSSGALNAALGYRLFI